MVKKITLNFFGEEVQVKSPKDLVSLRSKIAQVFLFSQSEASEILLTYNEEGDKVIIENEESYEIFLNSQINKIDLSISQSSQIYKENLDKIKKETEEDKKELEKLLKKNDEFKKLIEIKFDKEKKEINDIDFKINDLMKQKSSLKQKIKEGIQNLEKQKSENEKKIIELQKKLQLPLTIKELPPKKPYKKTSLKRKISKLQHKKYNFKKLPEKTTSNEPQNNIINTAMQEINDWTKFILSKTNEITENLVQKYQQIENKINLKAPLQKLNLLSERVTSTVPYEYKNCPIPGGGFVTGFLFDTVDKNVMYIRTDIGGTYRYDRENKKFISLINDVTMTDLSRTYPITFCTKEGVKGSLIVAGGKDNEKGRLWLSEDYGETFVEKDLPVCAHGNWNGRGTGERMVVFEDDVIIFASPRNGLYITKDKGDSWKELNVNGEQHFSFIFRKPDTNTIIVATAGVTTKKNDNLRGHSLYISYDRGENFEEVQEPFIEKMNFSKMTGFVGHRYCYDGENLFITMNHTGERAYIVEPGYTVDCGHVVGGVVLKYTFDENGKISTFKNVAPVEDYRTLDYGYGGISFSRQTPGLMVLSTITKLEGDIVYRSYDYGQTWENVLEGLRVGKIRFNAPYMRPECNGNDSLIHWLSQMEFNPYDDNEVWFNTGTGVFKTDNFKDNMPIFYDHCDGIEETVHLNLYAPTGSDVQLIDILGDLGGFAFRDVDTPCDNSFADANGNRYITCINADYSDQSPETVIVTPRGNWTGKTKGGLILTKDACHTFERLKMPFGLSDALDEHLHSIENPNVNSGWVAMSSDTKNLVWCVADNINLPKDLVIYSNDSGATWKKVNICECEDQNLKVFSDRVDSELFYGFSEKGNFFVSRDKGASFNIVDTNKSLEGVNFGLIDTINKTEIRVESGKTGVIYLACNVKGLHKLVYNKNTKSASVEKLSAEGDEVYRLGLGLLKEGEDYITSNKAIYICAKIDGVYGFYRSFDDGKTYERINTDKQMYGEVNSLDADKRTFGRFFIATGSRGVLYGKEKK